AEEVRGVIEAASPGSTDNEGTDETDQVQLPPGSIAGNAEHAEIEHGVVGKQDQMAATAQRSQFRSQEASCASQYRHGAGVLHHCQITGQCADCHQNAEAGCNRDQVIKTHGSMSGQIENADPATLDYLCIDGSLPTQTPAGSDQGRAAKSGCGQTQFQRKEPVLGRILDQKGNSDEENHYSQLDQQVLAAEEPGKPFFKRRWLRRL